MESGKLRHRISLLQPSTTKNSFGELNPPNAFAQVWAEIEALSGRELYQAQQRVSEVTHKVTIRYQPNVVAKMCVLFNDRLLRIQAVMNPQERNNTLELLCVEI